MTLILLYLKFKNNPIQQFRKPSLHSKANSIQNDFDIQIENPNQNIQLNGQELNKSESQKRNSENFQQSKISPLKNSNTQIPEQSQMAEEIILKQYDWIKGQQFIVYDNEENLILQTFLLSQFLNQNRSFNQTTEQEFLQQIMQIPISIGNRDLYELFFEFDLSNQEIILNSIDKNSFIPQEDFPKYPLRQAIPLIEIIRKIFSNYDRFRKNYFIAYKLDSVLQELQNIILKIFITQKKGKNYVFIQFDSSQQLTVASAKQIFNQQKIMNSIYQLLVMNTSNHLSFLITQSQLYELDENISEQFYQKYFDPIRITSLQLFFSYAFLRDYNQFIQNQFPIKISQFNVLDALEDVLTVLEEYSKSRQVQFNIENDLQENCNIVQTDIERFRILIYGILIHCLKYNKNSKITISVAQTVSNYLQFIIKGGGYVFEEKQYKTLINLLKRYAYSPQNSIIEFSHKGFTDDLPIITSYIIAKKLAGSFKKGLEISKNLQYTFYIESCINIPSQETVQQESLLRMVGPNKYFETSLTYTIGAKFSESFQQNESTFKQFTNSIFHSISQISKFSRKQSDVQSIQQSQSQKYNDSLSKINSKTLKSYLSKGSANNLSLKYIDNGSQKSPQSANYLDSFKGKQNTEQLNQVLMFNYVSCKNDKSDQSSCQLAPDSIQQNDDLSKLSFSDQNVQAELSNNKKAFFQSWRGSNQYIPKDQEKNPLEQSSLMIENDQNEQIKLPMANIPKFQNQIIKCKIGTQCCSKVLIMDQEFINIQLLQNVLKTYDIVYEYSFNKDDCLDIIENKQKNGCKRCKNNSFIVYFINMFQNLGQRRTQLSNLIKIKNAGIFNKQRVHYWFSWNDRFVRQERMLQEWDGLLYKYANPSAGIVLNIKVF